MSRVWMITGSNRGLGRAFAKTAATHGDKVIAAARTIKEDPFYKNENVLAVQLDVTKQEQIKQAVANGVQKFGHIDILINNAGFGMSGAFEEISDKELRNLFDTDYFGLVDVTKAVLPIMRKQNHGMILNVSSQGGLMGFTGSSAYNSAKFAVVGLSRALDMELEPFHIQVSAICPGSFRTDFRDNSSMKFPVHKMKEYDGTAVHAAPQFLKENNHKQNGDPDKAAQFIYKIVEKGKLPRRILIGKDCCQQVQDDLRQQLNEIELYKIASSETDF